MDNHPMLHALDQAIERLMPADDAQRRRAAIDEQNRREAQLAEELRKQCAEVISLMAEAIRRPLISRGEVEQAVKHLSAALHAARQLDPE